MSIEQSAASSEASSIESLQPEEGRGETTTPAQNPRSSRRYTLLSAAAIVLLVGALLAVYWRQLSPALWGQSRAGGAMDYVADLDFWKRTPRETFVSANAYFDLAHDLNEVPLEIGEWKGVDVPETNQEVMILLEPEQYIQRLYQQGDNGQYMWLTMVGGRSSQPFHAPDICYDADGWQYNLGSHAVELPLGGQVHGLYLLAEKVFPGETTPTHHVVFYFYLFPNDQRNLADGIVLFKLTSGLIGSLEETLKLHDNFVQHFFTSARAGKS